MPAQSRNGAGQTEQDGWPPVVTSAPFMPRAFWPNRPWSC